MEITGIRPQIKDKTRCNIETDGRFCCGMKIETVTYYRLKVGMIISEEELSRIQLESEKASAFDKALTNLSVSPKSEREIRIFLERKGYLEDVVDYVVEKMKGYGFLDDKEYAARYVQSSGTRKGKRLIALELRKKGISQEEIDSAIEEISDEREKADSLLRKYLRGKASDRGTLRKAYAYLISRGFDFDLARAVIQSYGETEDED